MSALKEIKFPKPIKGFIGAKQEIIEGEVKWVMIAPTKKAKGWRSLSKGVK